MMTPKRLLYGLLSLYLVLAAAHAVLTPLWQGHEVDYYNVIRFLTTQGRLPTPDDYPAGDADIRQATQPPLYFIITTPVVAAFDNGQRVPYGINPTTICLGGQAANAIFAAYSTDQAYDQPFQGTVAAGYALRLLNVLFGAVAVVLTYMTARVLFPDRAISAWVAAALLAFEPNTLQTMILINNDTLALTVTAAALYFSAKVLRAPKLTVRVMIPLIVFGLVAPLVKLTGWVALIIALGVLAYKLIFTKRGRSIALLGIGAVLLLTLGIGLFNLQQYGNLLGRYSVLDSFAVSLLNHLQLPLVVVRAVLEATGSALLEPLAALQPRAAVIYVYMAILLLALVGVVVGAVQALVKRDRTVITAYGLLIVMVVIAVLMVLLRNTLIATAENTTIYHTSTIFAPVRYYTPALPPLAILIAVGLTSFLPKRLSRVGTLLALVPVAAFVLVAVANAVLIVAVRPANPVVAANGLQRTPLIASAQAPQVLDYDLQTDASRGWLDLTLYLTLAERTDLNYVAETALVSGQTTLDLCQFYPAHGIYTTPRWHVGDVVAVRAIIPNCAAAFPDTADFTLRWIGYSTTGAVEVSTDPVILTRVTESLAQADTCPPDLGVIGDGLQLVKWNSPPSVRRDETYLPSVNWIVRSAVPAAALHVFAFTHDQTGTRYTCLGSLADDLHPMSGWQQGEYVYFDECVMSFPPDAPTGTYTVSVGVQDASGAYLAALTPQGSTTDFLIVGHVQLEP